jgi:very-short-patch-repair endonuclease
VPNVQLWITSGQLPEIGHAPPMQWERIARRQHGIIARHQVLGSGVGLGALATLIERGALVRQLQGVYLVRGAPNTYEASLWVAVLATEGVLGFGTACYLWQMIDEPPAPITILVPHRRRIAVPRGVRVRRRTRPIAAEKRWGLPVTVRAMSLMDHLSMIGESASSSLFDRALQRGWLGPADVVRRLQTPMWGNSRLRVLADRLGDGAASEFERRLHRLLRSVGLRGWTPNFPVVVNDVLIALIDVAFEDLMLAIELDGLAFHVDHVAFRRDRARQNQLIGLGWRVLRFTWDDLSYRPEYVVRTIRRELGRAA